MIEILIFYETLEKVSITKDLSNSFWLCLLKLKNFLGLIK